MTDLSDLIERVEAGEGSRELDGDIAVAVKAVPPFVSRRDSPEWTSWSGGRDYWDAPHYTTSLDAAMTLIPEGMFARLFCEQPQAIIIRRSPTDVSWREISRSKLNTTPALALVAASLRALQSRKDGE